MIEEEKNDDDSRADEKFDLWSPTMGKEDVWDCHLPSATPVHNLQCTTYSAQPAVHNQQCTTNSAQPAVHNQQCTTNSAQLTVHNQQYTTNSALCTLNFAQATVQKDRVK